MEPEKLQRLTEGMRMRREAERAERLRRKIAGRPISGQVWIVQCERGVRYEVFGPLKPRHCPACGQKALVNKKQSSGNP